MDQSGRQSMANFAERGTGDAVVTYENELLLRNKESEPIPYVIPPATLLIESPAAVVETSVESHGSRAVAEAFLEFLALRPRAADRRRVWVPAGEAGCRGARRRTAAPRQAVHDGRPGRLGQDRGGALRAQGALDVDFHREHQRASRGEISANGLGHPQIPAAAARTSCCAATTLFYLGLMVVLPMAALAIEAARPGAAAFAEALRDPYAWHALKLTFITALVMVVVNVLTGTATAWVLVRYDFPGRTLVNALIDLPFAVPTVVTGVMLVVLFGPSSVVGTILGRYGWGVIYHQPGIVLALLFVTYPFVIRSVQPVLMELDRAEEEAAATLGAGAWTTFRRVTLPALWPSILTGAAVSFSRALGEFGSVVMVAGNQPLATKTAPLYIFGEIESGNRHGALVDLGGAPGVVALDLARLERDPAALGGRAWPLTCWNDAFVPTRRRLRGRRSWPIGRWLLIAAVLGWFALLILVPSVALCARS